MLRQEVYELDVDALRRRASRFRCVCSPPPPTTATSAACSQRARTGTRSFSSPRARRSPITTSSICARSRSLTIRKHSRAHPDPRVAHTLNLIIDELRQRSAVHRDRLRTRAPVQRLRTIRQIDSLINEVQNEHHLAYTETHYTNDAIEPPAGSARRSAVSFTCALRSADLRAHRVHTVARLLFRSRSTCAVMR